MADIFDLYRNGLKKTRKSFVERLVKVVRGGKDNWDQDLLEDIEEIMLSADIGYDIVSRIMDRLQQCKANGEDMEVVLKDSLYKILQGKERGLNIGDNLSVVLFVGVNGVGKTTTIAKVASQLSAEGKKVIVAAGDTYRAAGGDQMQIWGRRLGIRVITAPRGSDASSLVYDSLDAAEAENADVILVDTAGRLHNNRKLMDELQKIRRIIQKKTGDQPQETLLVVDAATGQNALRQAEVFNEEMSLTGLVITKLDGSAKGGMVFPIEEKTGLAVKYIGMGEKKDDLSPFDPEAFVQAMFEV